MTVMNLPKVSDDELAAVERAFDTAFEKRSVEHMKVLGFGEISVSIGWPTNNPSIVLKRLIAPEDWDRAETDIAQIRDYIEQIEACGVKVVPTELRIVKRSDGGPAPYIIQPLIPREYLAEAVLEESAPQIDHPMIEAVCEACLKGCTAEHSIDPQIPNFAWYENEVWLMDISTPMLFKPDGSLASDIDPILRTLPGVLSPATKPAIRKIYGYYYSPRGALMQSMVFLHRIGEEDWIDAVAETYNKKLDEAIDLKVISDRYAKQIKEFPRLKRMTMLKRWWVERVKGRRFQYLITDSFSGKIL